MSTHEEVPLDNEASKSDSPDRCSSSNVNFYSTRVSGSSGSAGVNSVDVSHKIVKRARRTGCDSPKSFKKRVEKKDDKLTWTKERIECFRYCFNRLPINDRGHKKLYDEMRKLDPDISYEDLYKYQKKYKRNLERYGNLAKPSSSTKPNSQIPLQNHSISTNPSFNFPIQRPSNFSNPNFNFPIQRPSNSSNPNSQIHITSPSIYPSPNSHFPIQTPSNFTNPNFHFPLQSSINSNNPSSRFPFQNSSNFTNPNFRFPLLSSSVSTNPNSTFSLQCPSIPTDPNSLFPRWSSFNFARPHSRHPLQSPSILTRPINSNFHFQSSSISSSPNSLLSFQSPSNFTHPNYLFSSQNYSSISTNPNIHFPPQSHSISTHPNPQLDNLQRAIQHLPLLNQTLSHCDDTNLSNHDKVGFRSFSNVDNNNVAVHGGANNYSNMVNAFESQGNPCRVIEQSANNLPSDFSLSANQFADPIISNNDHNQLISNFDGDDNDLDPIILGKFFGGLSAKDYSLFDDPSNSL